MIGMKVISPIYIENGEIFVFKSSNSNWFTVDAPLIIMRLEHMSPDNRIKFIERVKAIYENHQDSTIC